MCSEAQPPLPHHLVAACLLKKQKFILHVENTEMRAAENPLRNRTLRISNCNEILLVTLLLSLAAESRIQKLSVAKVAI